MAKFDNTRKELDNLLSRHAKHVSAAEEAQKNGDMVTAKAELQKAQGLNDEIAEKKAFVEEADRYANDHAPKFGSDRKDLEEMGRALAARERVKIDISDVFAGLRQNSGTLVSGSVVAPQGGGSEIRDGFNAHVSSLVDQVNAVSLAGMSSWEEPYVVSDMEARAGKVATVAGTTRTASDPAFAKAKLNAYEVSVTSFVDRNISRLSPTDYAAKVQLMAMRALRRKINGFIVNGDGQASPDVFGILNAKNTDGKEIFTTINDVAAIDANTLTNLVFAYGGDEIVGGNARLILSKKSLMAFGSLRGTNEKKRLYNIRPDAGNPNTGVIEDGGLIVPYTISSDIGDSALSYGDPYNYMLGLFGDYVIRVDESVKAVERMFAILGDVVIGGNLTVDKGFVNTKLTGDAAAAV